MFRSRFLLGVSGPAAIVALLVQPMIRQTADAWAGSPSFTPVPMSAPAPSARPLPGMRPVSTAISPIHMAAVPRSDVRPAPATASQAEEKAQMSIKPRRMVREGCETPVSSLVGPEARRMVPGRCIA